MIGRIGLLSMAILSLCLQCASSATASDASVDSSVADVAVLDGPVECFGDAACCSAQPPTVWISCPANRLDGGVACRGGPPAFSNSKIDPDASFDEGCQLTVGCESCFCAHHFGYAWTCPL